MEKPRTSVDFDHCNKYDLIFKVLCNNMNYCTCKADLDVTVDESTWGFAGYCGEAGWRLMKKPVSKGTNCIIIINFFSITSNDSVNCNRWPNYNVV